MTVSLCNIHWSSFLNGRIFFINTVRFDLILINKKLVPKSLVQIVLHFRLFYTRGRCDVFEAGPVPVVRGLFCYSLLVFRGGCFLYLWFVLIHSILYYYCLWIQWCWSWLETLILWLLLWNVTLWEQRLRVEP